jgi:hypothetical protein
MILQHMMKRRILLNELSAVSSLLALKKQVNHLSVNKKNHFGFLTPVHSIKQVNSVKVLGYHANRNLSSISHLDHVSSLANHRILKQLQLRSDVQGLTVVFNALILCKILFNSQVPNFLWLPIRARYSQVRGCS